MSTAPGLGETTDVGRVGRQAAARARWREVGQLTYLLAYAAAAPRTLAAAPHQAEKRYFRGFTP